MSSAIAEPTTFEPVLLPYRPCICWGPNPPPPRRPELRSIRRPAIRSKAPDRPPVLGPDRRTRAAPSPCRSSSNEGSPLRRTSSSADGSDDRRLRDRRRGSSSRPYLSLMRSFLGRRWAQVFGCGPDPRPVLGSPYLPRLTCRGAESY